MGFLSNFLKRKKTKRILYGRTTIETEDSWDAYILLERAKKSFREANYFATLKLLEEASKKNLLIDNPDYASEFYSLRASTNQECNHRFEAINDYKLAIEQSKDDCNLYFSLSLCYSEVNDIPNSIENLKKAIELSKIDNHLTRKYKQNAKETGVGDLTMLYEISLHREQERLDFEQ